MTQRDEALANQEDDRAIAALLKDALDLQIQVKVQRRQTCLRVLLEGDPIPEQAAAIAQWFLVACLLAPVVAFLVLRYESWFQRGVNLLLKQEP